MLTSPFYAVLAASAFLLIGVHAEQHTIQFVNNCGFGTPNLLIGGALVSTGQTVTVNGPVINAIAFLQTGNCGANGEGCIVIEFSLENPTSPGTGSSADISLVPPHAFSVTSGFGFIGTGCDGLGQDCTTPNCPAPSGPPGQGPPQTRCDADNAGIVITFCD